MGDLHTSQKALALTDPFKRVKYSQGLVLGEDEFEQEQAYLLERGRLRNRALHGYGTVWGLAVTVQGSRVTVSPGLAIDPQGREIRVAPAQVADLHEWLMAPDNQEALRASGTGSPMKSLYVVLRHVDYETDPVPVAGKIDRHRDTVVASRVTESFELHFTVDPPNQVEEDTVRAFGDLLDRIELTTERKGLSPAQMEVQVRDLARYAGVISSQQRLPVHPDRAEEVLRAAFRVWVTEVRPALMKDAARFEYREDPGVLLGRVEFRQSDSGAVYDLRVMEEDRPYLLHSRLLREYIMRGRDIMLARGAGGRFEAHASASKLQGREIAATPPPDGAVLTWNDALDRWEPRMLRLNELGGAALPIMPFVTITHLLSTPYPTFEVWFHVSHRWTAEGHLPALVGDFLVDVYAEADEGRYPWRKLAVMSQGSKARNKYLVVLEPEAARCGYLRFDFHLNTMRLSRGQSLLDWLQERPERWVGFDGESVVTAYHVQSGQGHGHNLWERSAAAGALAPAPAPAEKEEPAEVAAPAPVEKEAQLEPVKAPPEAVVPAAPETRETSTPFKPVQPGAEPVAPGEGPPIRRSGTLPKRARGKVEQPKRSFLVKAWRWIIGLD